MIIASLVLIIVLGCCAALYEKLYFSDDTSCLYQHDLDEEDKWL